MEITSRRQRLRRAGSTLLHCAVAGLAAGTLLAEFGDRWWIADFFAHFRFQYMAVALAATALALLMRLRRLAAVACLLIIPQVIVIAGVPTADRAGDAAPSARIRVVTANIQWRNSSFETLTSHFRDAQADVIALEELTPAALPLIQALQKDYPHIAPADWQEKASGVALLSRHPIENVRFQRATWAPIVEATVRHPAGPFRFIALHAPYPMSSSLYEMHRHYFYAWVRQAAQSNTPIVVTGDFNLTPWSPRFRAAWRASGLSFAGEYRLWPKTWPAHAVPWKYLPGVLIGGIPIDHVLVSRHFSVIDMRRGPYIGSDHYPVRVDLRLRP